MASAAENKIMKRRSILDAATRLFIDKSFAETAIDEVVQLAGVAKGTFYLYFRDKYDLFDQIVMHRTAEIFVESCRSLHGSAASLTAQFTALCDNIIGYLQENKKVTALIDRRFSTCFTQGMLDEHEGFRTEVDYLTDLLSARFSHDEARKRLFILLDMIGSVACSAILSGNPYSLEQLLPTLHSVLCDFLGGDNS